MGERTTRRLLADDAGIRAAGEVIRAGGLVAFPTETVYGLGANALDARAVAGIFEAKRRPADDPLIVHVADLDEVRRVASEVPEAARRLAESFWPGPLTLVLPKHADVPANATAGLDTVGVRVPAHPVARALIRAAGVPIAAPSANLFSRPSPTRAEHVVEDLDGRVDVVLDGGPTEVGVESTIVDACGPRPRLLRPGGVPAEAIERVLGIALLTPPPRAAGPVMAPGMLDVHYAPRTPLVLVTGPARAARPRLLRELREAVRAGLRVGLLLLEEDRDAVPPEVLTVQLGSFNQPASSAARLFDALRTLDRAGLDVLYARDAADPRIGLGRALRDRLRRASARRIETAPTAAREPR